MAPITCKRVTLKWRIDMISKKATLLFPVLALPYFASASPVTFQKSLTYDTVAKPVFKILRDLSAATGKKYKAVGPVANEPVIVAVTDVAADELLNRLAEAVLGRWKDADGYKVLELDPSKVIAAEKTEHSAAVAETQRRLKERMADLDKVPLSETALTAQFQRTLEFYTRPMTNEGLLPPSGPPDLVKPGERLTDRLLLRLGPEVLVDLPEKTVIVFSTNPGSGERSFPFPVDDLIEKYRSEQLAWAKVAENMHPVGQWEHLFEEDAEFLKHERNKLEVKLSITNRSFWNCSATISDATGPFDGGGVNWDDADEFRLSPTSWSPPVEKIVWKLSSESEALVKGFPKGRLTGNSRTLLLSPTVRDPLSYGISEVLLQLAHRSNLSLIAILEDRLAYEYEWPLYSPNSAKVLTKYLNDCEEVIQQKGKWLVVAPLRAASRQRQRVDRGSLEELAKGVESDEFGALEKLASFLYANPYANRAGLAERLLKSLHPRRPWPELEQARFYGALSDTQRAALLAGRELTYGDLNAAQRSLLVGIGNVNALGVKYQATDTADEYGVPYDLRLGMKESILPVGVSSGRYGVTVVTPGWYAARLHRMSGVYYEERYMPRIVSPAEYRHLYFHAVGTRFETSFSLGETRRDSGIEGPIEKLPKAFYDQVKVEEKRVIESNKKFEEELVRNRAGGGGQATA